MQTIFTHFRPKLIVFRPYRLIHIINFLSHVSNSTPISHIHRFRHQNQSSIYSRVSRRIHSPPPLASKPPAPTQTQALTAASRLSRQLPARLSSLSKANSRLDSLRGRGDYAEIVKLCLRSTPRLSLTLLSSCFARCLAGSVY